MSDAVVKTSIAGKIRNFHDFKSEALLPVFEAVVNSIHAIEEANNLSNGSITVRVRRDLSQGTLGLDGDDSLPNIIGFEIEDDGIGFNDRNYESFETSDSIYKLAIGGKGVGRFSWLKAFDKVEINSIYLAPNNKSSERKILFTIADGVKEIANKAIGHTNIKTVVHLIGFQEYYRKQSSAYKTTTKIAQRIFEHCLTRYISGFSLV